MSYKETREEIDRLAKSINSVVIVWGVDDVRSVTDKKLTDIECMEILKNVIGNHDCNYGITWDHLKTSINQLF